jgi:hypothetical protein
MQQQLNDGTPVPLAPALADHRPAIGDIVGAEQEVAAP